MKIPPIQIPLGKTVIQSFDKDGLEETVDFIVSLESTDEEKGDLFYLLKDRDTPLLSDFGFDLQSLVWYGTQPIDLTLKENYHYMHALVDLLIAKTIYHSVDSGLDNQTRYRAEKELFKLLIPDLRTRTINQCVAQTLESRGIIDRIPIAINYEDKCYAVPSYTDFIHPDNPEVVTITNKITQEVNKIIKLIRKGRLLFLLKMWLE